MRISLLETNVCVKSSVHVKYIQLTSPVTPVSSNSVITLPLQEEACLCAFPLKEHTPYEYRAQVRWTVRCALLTFIHSFDCQIAQRNEKVKYTFILTSSREYLACKQGSEAASLVNCSNAKSMWVHKVSEIKNHYLLIFFSMALLSGFLLIPRRCAVMFIKYACMHAST